MEDTERYILLAVLIPAMIYILYIGIKDILK